MAFASQKLINNKQLKDYEKTAKKPTAIRLIHGVASSINTYFAKFDNGLEIITSTMPFLLIA